MCSAIDAIFKSVSQGGFVMIPYTILVFVWLGAIVMEFFGKPLCRHPLAYLLFPMGFLILGMLRIALSLYSHSKILAWAGSADPGQMAADGMVLSRALFAITAAAVLSWLTAIVVMFCRAKAKN